ncbi:hypothetical protein ACFVYR_36585 [Streptomyces sp. NPDC058284]|uniref:hypothetical protein n=1 Tax=unclassified Streptomyces TaxID=2593676 RepID=UPI00364D458C
MPAGTKIGNVSRARYEEFIAEDRGGDLQFRLAARRACRRCQGPLHAPVLLGLAR